MKTFAIINGTTLKVIERATIQDAITYAENFADHSKEVLVREIEHEQSECGNTREWYIIMSGGNRIAETSSKNVGFDHQAKNARLIAAAPDLLEALQLIKNVLSGWDGEGKYINLIEHAKTAINKAHAL